MTLIGDDNGVADDLLRPDQPPTHRAADVEELLTAAIEQLEAARPMPLSNASMINREEVLELLLRAFDSLPEELRAARWLLRERDEYLEQVRLEGEQILDVSRSQAERMVERTEVAKSAEQRARLILSDAEAESRRMRRETEDFCDARLASLEGILDRTRTVGRNRLQGVAPVLDVTDAATSDELNADAERPGLFDQDFS